MPTRRDAWLFISLSLPFLAAILLPFLAAARAGGEAYVFAGLLQNPIDGNSYLAKMAQGWQGNWTFTLPYTADPGKGAYLFLFYLFLGHIARLAGLSTILVFHIARLGCAGLMLLAIWRFFGFVLPVPQARPLAYTIAIYGSGLGWLAALGGAFTSDFWVAEAYPFLSAFANPHFPLGLALVLALIGTAAAGKHEGNPWELTGMALGGLLLGLVMPFGLVVAGVVLAGLVAWERRKGRPILRLVSFLAGGTPVLVYDLWVASVHPALAGWNAQNQTPAPPAWDLLLSFSPVLCLAIFGAWRALRVGEFRARPLLVWAGLGLLLIYLPFGLQRRFILGLYIPLAGLAAHGLHLLGRGSGRRATVLVGAFFLLALPSNLAILLAAGQGITAHSASLFLGRSEHQAMVWVRANTPEKAVILASPETSLFIPAQTGRRVVAGHPFETVQASRRAGQVMTILGGSPSPESLSLLEEVDYVFVGPRERALGGFQPAGSWQAVYVQNGVTIWAADP